MREEKALLSTALSFRCCWEEAAGKAAKVSRPLYGASRPGDLQRLRGKGEAPLCLPEGGLALLTSPGLPQGVCQGLGASPSALASGWGCVLLLNVHVVVFP